MPIAPLILVVEDEPDLELLLTSVLEEDGYRVASANGFSLGAEIMRAIRPDLLIANVRLRDGDGHDLAKLAKSMNIPVLLISGDDTTIEQHSEDPNFLQKPFRMTALESAIERLVGTPPNFLFGSSR